MQRSEARLAARRIEERLLWALQHGERSYWGVLRDGEAQADAVVGALRALLDAGEVATKEDRFVLTEAGRARLSALALDRLVDPGCEACGGRGMRLKPPFDGVLQAFRERLKRRPKAAPEFDQGVVTPETAVLRLSLLARRGDLAGRDLLLLGDDDLMSLAAALSGFPRRVHVLDVDARVVAFIREVAREEGWDHVSAEVYDVREPLPAALRGAFDVFFTDPVETLPGILLFLSRATEALREGGAGYFGLSYLEASWSKWRDIQRGILEMGYAITDALPAYQDYELEDIVALGYPVAQAAPVAVREPDVPFYRSTVFRLVLVASPAPRYTGRVELDRDLYYDDEASVTLPR
ncbi:MAG: bis-aminopropyl spermidine synthase family protein [Hydrogenibacillus schlegelii]|uniref:Bis-aminopropyl spermidine synthase family protein n=1 Tax=Hydrogenibacillus schlegelii TaxID=1484 RepID=A0A947GBA7_HYDSH|nr:bis-aminopropyl spermidine synthase family protein [Hydrogenibacillus schlegelii]